MSKKWSSIQPYEYVCLPTKWEWGSSQLIGAPQITLLVLNKHDNHILAYAQGALDLGGQYPGQLYVQEITICFYEKDTYIIEDHMAYDL